MISLLLPSTVDIRYQLREPPVAAAPKIGVP